MSKRTLLVVGATPMSRSLGDTIADRAKRTGPWKSVVTAGITGENIELDLTNPRRIDEILIQPFTDVVCTVGVSGAQHSLFDTMYINAVYPLWFAERWASRAIKYHDVVECNFVGISSNSATIARSDSVAYCASKAALSQGLRTLGRQYSKLDKLTSIRIWGYELGFLADTPMSVETTKRYKDVPHRIPDPALSRGLPVRMIADKILGDIVNHSMLLQATMQRIDAGDQ